MNHYNIYIYIYIYICVCVCVCLCMCVYLHMYLLCICLYMCIYICVYMCIYTYMYMCACVYAWLMVLRMCSLHAFLCSTTLPYIERILDFTLNYKKFLPRKISLWCSWSVLLSRYFACCCLANMSFLSFLSFPCIRVRCIAKFYTGVRY